MISSDRDECRGPHIESFAKRPRLFLDVTLGPELGHLAAQPIDLELLGSHLPVPWKGMLWIGCLGLDPAAENRLVDIEITRGLRHRHATLCHELHRFGLELLTELPSLH